jgi:hypothetical protein
MSCCNVDAYCNTIVLQQTAVGVGRCAVLIKAVALIGVGCTLQVLPGRICTALSRCHGVDTARRVLSCPVTRTLASTGVCEGRIVCSLTGGPDRVHACDAAGFFHGRKLLFPSPGLNELRSSGRIRTYSEVLIPGRSSTSCQTSTRHSICCHPPRIAEKQHGSAADHPCLVQSPPHQV